MSQTYSTLDQCILSDAGLRACVSHVIRSASIKTPVDAALEHKIMISCRDLVLDQHARNVRAGWWTDPKTGERKERNFGELLMLMVSEIGEIPVDPRDRLQVLDDKLPERLMFEVELADFLIRLWDTAGAYHDVRFPMAFSVFAHQTEPCLSSGTLVETVLHYIISKLSRAMEAHRKSKAPDEIAIPLAEAMVAVCRLGEAQGFDLPGAVCDKIAFNAQRADHKLENRIAPGGKLY